MSINNQFYIFSFIYFIKKISEGFSMLMEIIVHTKLLTYILTREEIKKGRRMEYGKVVIYIQEIYEKLIFYVFYEKKNNKIR